MMHDELSPQDAAEVAEWWLQAFEGLGQFGVSNASPSSFHGALEREHASSVEPNGRIATD